MDFHPSPLPGHRHLSSGDTVCSYCLSRLTGDKLLVDFPCPLSNNCRLFKPPPGSYSSAIPILAAYLILLLDIFLKFLSLERFKEIELTGKHEHKQHADGILLLVL